MLTSPTTATYLSDLQSTFRSTAKGIFLKYQFDQVILLLKINWSKTENLLISKDKQASLPPNFTFPILPPVILHQSLTHLPGTSPMIHLHSCLHTFALGALYLVCPTHLLRAASEQVLYPYYPKHFHTLCPSSSWHLSHIIFLSPPLNTLRGFH